MKKFLNKLTPIAIVLIIAIVVIIVTRECRHIPEAVETHTTDTIKVTEYVYDTTEIVKYISKPGIKETIYVDVPVDVNVTEVVNDYYTMKVYNPVYLDDTSAYISTIDTVFKNELYSSELVFINRRPTAINHNTIITYDTCKPCKHWNIGVGALIGGYTDKFGAGPSVIVSTNKKMSYTASYDFIQKIGYFGIYFNVR